MEERSVLPPGIGQELFGVTLKQYEIQLYLNNKMRKGRPDPETETNNWLVVHSLALYGVVRSAAFLLGRKCERDTKRVIADANALLRQVVDYLTNDGRDLDRARELYDRVREQEANIYITMSRCTGIPLTG